MLGVTVRPTSPPATPRWSVSAAYHSDVYESLGFGGSEGRGDNLQSFGCGSPPFVSGVPGMYEDEGFGSAAPTQAETQPTVAAWNLKQLSPSHSRGIHSLVLFWFFPE